MKTFVKKSANTFLNALGFEVRRIKPKGSSKYSNFDEEQIIAAYLERIKLQSQYCVDIGANDGITMSNTFALFSNGWEGLAIEFDGEKFSKLTYAYKKFQKTYLCKCKATPENIVALLKACQAPREIGFLNLDIDGYDYYVLDRIMGSFRPSLLCVEINEKIPPPLKFTVKWDPDYVWREDHFYGQSISQLDMLCNQYGYALVKLHYNNAFLIPREISPDPALSPVEAYRTGYLEYSDRKEKFPWNADMEELLNLRPEEARDFLNKFFEAYTGKYVLDL